MKTRMPNNIVPGLHSEFGHHYNSSLPGNTVPLDPGCNKRRIMNLHRPYWYPLTIPRRVSVEEWQATRQPPNPIKSPGHMERYQSALVSINEALHLLHRVK